MKESDIILQTGDIFLTDDFSPQSKLIKFLMQSPTIWHHLWRWLRGTLQTVRFYHAGMVLNQYQMIEQQSKVLIRNNDVIFKNNKNYVVWRKKNLTNIDKLALKCSAYEDIGKGYDIILCIGKALTWITGIKWFARNIQKAEQDICVTRVAGWYAVAINEYFGCKSYHEVTTKIIDEYCYNHLDKWHRVAIKYGIKGEVW